MPSKINLIYLLFHRQRPPSVDQHENPGTTLIKLPPELLHMITEHLLPNDTASLILCNHALLRTLGTRHWSSLHPGKGNEKYRELFLTALTRDLPRHFFCHHCSRLHLQDNLGPPGPALQPKNRLLCIEHHLDAGNRLRQCVQVHRIESRYSFTFPHLQLAMKRHFYGIKHGISTESLSFTEVQVFLGEDEIERVITLLSVEARICSKPTSLCLRIQHWALISSTNRDMLLSKTGFVQICDHLSTHSSEISRLVQSILEPRRPEVEDQIRTELFRCRRCNTNFQLEIKDLGDEGLALVITKWLDLGSGSTPTDSRWSRHLFRLRAATIGASAEAWGVRLRFESEPGPSQDDLSRENASYLISKRFMNSMDHWSDTTWILQAGKRLPMSIYSILDRSFFFLNVLSNLYLMLYMWVMFFRS